MSLALPSWVPSLPNALSDLESSLDTLGDRVESSLTHLRHSIGSSLLPIITPQPPAEKPATEQARVVEDSIDSVLPKELMLFIFSFLDVKSLSYRASLVCQRWFRLSNDDSIWKERFWRDVKSWDSFLSSECKSSKSWYLSTQKALYGKIFGESEDAASSEDTVSWKHKFLMQYNCNSEDYKNHIKLRTAPISNHQRKVDPYAGLGFRSPFGFKMYKILIVGEGLETSAKCLVYEMMWGANTPFKMTKLYPGNGGIGSGVGFELNGVDLNISAIYNHAQVLQRGAQQQWIDLFRETHAVMFVMDVYGDTTTVKQELAALLQPQNGLSANAPLIVLACKHHSAKNVKADPPPAESLPSAFTDMAPFEIAEKLELNNKLTRKWCVRKVDVETLDGVYQSLDWLLSIL